MPIEDIYFDTEEELLEFIQDNELWGLDSEYSGRSQALVKKHGAKGMDLNHWWVITPESWICPSCQRGKPDIVRVNKHGYLTGHLHEHHDHMSDFVEKEFTRISESKDIVVADLMAKRFVTRTAFALSAYDNTVLCSDCNAADAKAKSLLGAPGEFSFSPGDIAQFIQVHPNREHGINVEVARQVWNDNKETFKIRKNLVRQIAEIGASNRHWYQPSKITAKIIQRRGEFHIQTYGLKAINIADPESLLYKTNKFAGNLDSWRRKVVRRDETPPTPAELQHLINMSTGHWEKASEDWTCPVCKRSKFQCVRRSNKGNWQFILSTSKVLFDALSPEHFQHLKVCNDCSRTATHIGQEGQGQAGLRLSYSSALVSPQELTDAIVAHPHSKHVINNQAVDRLLETIRTRICEGRYRA